MKRFSINTLNTLITETLIKNGVCAEQARIISDCMVMADACGVHSHGLNVLPAYIKKIENKSFNVSGNPLIIKETSAYTLLDSNNLIGMYSAWFCMDVAIKKCQENGIHYVSSRNCNTFGPAFYYTRYAAERGMIGICFSNSPSAMPAWGGKKKILGTNPFSVAIPSKTKGIIILDMASSIVAKSKINELRKEGKEIPQGWALDAKGNPTTNASEAIDGMLLPMAEHKGYAISMMIDVLAGLLSGAGFLNNINRFYTDKKVGMNVGHTFIAINPNVIYDGDFYDAVDKYIEEIHSSGDNVLFPGERKNNNYTRSQTTGVELSNVTINELKKIICDFERRALIWED